MSNKKKITKRNLTQYLTDRNDSVILNKEEAPKRKRGRPKGSKSSLFSSADKKKQQAAKRTLKDKRSTIEKLEKKLRSKRNPSDNKKKQFVSLRTPRMNRQYQNRGR